jgi:NAD(P)-dependent dehydrogenase (short-subunit alcohol dehydrogenase family)
VAALKASVPFLDEQDAPRLLALPLDLSRPTSVEDFASRVMSITPSVHWLFLNAAVGDVASSLWGSKPVLTADGHEQTVATNYFGHYLLCRHLLKALTFAAPSRIVSVSCGRHKHAWPLDHTNWQSLNPSPWWHPVHFKAGDAYNNSKVMNVLMAFKFSVRSQPWKPQHACALLTALSILQPASAHMPWPTACPQTRWTRASCRAQACCATSRPFTGPRMSTSRRPRGRWRCAW